MRGLGLEGQRGAIRLRLSLSSSLHSTPNQPLNTPQLPWLTTQPAAHSILSPFAESRSLPSRSSRSLSRVLQLLATLPYLHQPFRIPTRRRLRPRSSLLVAQLSSPTPTSHLASVVATGERTKESDQHGPMTFLNRPTTGVLAKGEGLEALLPEGGSSQGARSLLLRLPVLVGSRVPLPRSAPLSPSLPRLPPLLSHLPRLLLLLLRHRPLALPLLRRRSSNPLPLPSRPRYLFPLRPSLASAPG